MTDPHASHTQIPPSNHEQQLNPLDDMQPVQNAGPDDTQPVRALSIGQGSGARMRRLFVVIGIGFTFVIGGIVMALSLLAAPGTDDGSSVIIESSSGSRRLVTQADTVGALLTEQGISLGDNDHVSPALDAPLTNNMTIQILESYTVAVTLDDQTTILQTTSRRPIEVLQEVGITLAQSDKIFIDGQQYEPESLDREIAALNIVVQRGIQVTIVDGDDVIELTSHGQTVGETLVEAGVTLFLADVVTPDISTTLSRGMVVVISRSKPLTIVVDGERIQTRTVAQSIADAVADAGITLAGLDYTFPALDAPVVANTSVRVIRVTEEPVTEETTASYETVYQANAEMMLDTRRILQAGQDGIIEHTYRVRYENGVEVDRVLENEIQRQEARNQVIAYGTNIVLRTLSTPEGPVEYWRRLRVYATSYHPEALGGDDVTATGMRLRKGVVAVDPTIIPYRTNVYVEGYGTGVVADTGPKRANPYWIDLGYSDDDFRNWHRWVDVYLLTPVPADVQYLLPLRAEGGPVQ